MTQNGFADIESMASSHVVPGPPHASPNASVMGSSYSTHRGDPATELRAALEREARELRQRDGQKDHPTCDVDLQSSVAQSCESIPVAKAASAGTRAGGKNKRTMLELISEVRNLLSLVESGVHSLWEAGCLAGNQSAQLTCSKSLDSRAVVQQTGSTAHSSSNDLTTPVSNECDNYHEKCLQYLALLKDTVAVIEAGDTAVVSTGRSMMPGTGSAMLASPTSRLRELEIAGEEEVDTDVRDWLNMTFREGPVPYAGGDHSMSWRKSSIYKPESVLAYSFSISGSPKEKTFDGTKEFGDMTSESSTPRQLSQPAKHVVLNESIAEAVTSKSSSSSSLSRTAKQAGVSVSESPNDASPPARMAEVPSMDSKGSETFPRSALRHSLATSKSVIERVSFKRGVHHAVGEQERKAIVDSLDVPYIEYLNDSGEYHLWKEAERHGDNLLTVVAVNVFAQYAFTQTFDFDWRMFKRFCTVATRYYRASNLYHNAIHAADVLHSTHMILNQQLLGGKLKDLELFACLFAALMHDVGHVGVNNAFLKAIDHPIAQLYRVSPLESMHCSLALKLFNDRNLRFIPVDAWAKEERLAFEELVADIIIATDMKYHARTVQEVKDIFGDDGTSTVKEKSVATLLTCLVHAADLSNPTKSFDVYCGMAEGVLAEFWTQGDAEAERGLPKSVLCDRATGKFAQSQIGFIRFVVQPFMDAMASALPKYWLLNLRTNVELLSGLSVEEEADRLASITLKSKYGWRDIPRDSPYHIYGVMFADTASGRATSSTSSGKVWSNLSPSVSNNRGWRPLGRPYTPSPKPSLGWSLSMEESGLDSSERMQLLAQQSTRTFGSGSNIGNASTRSKSAGNSRPDDTPGTRISGVERTTLVGVRQLRDRLPQGSRGITALVHWKDDMLQRGTEKKQN